jgi:quercetin dioxygenase-like cupin family protein
MSELQVRRLEKPDEQRTFDLGRFEVLEIGGMTIGQATYEPGWRWSTHVGGSPEARCDVEHVGLVLAGRTGVLMNDGTEVVLRPGDFFHVPPGHDSWVVGDEQYVSLHFLGAGEYAKD